MGVNQLMRMCMLFLVLTMPFSYSLQVSGISVQEGISRATIDFQTDEDAKVAVAYGEGDFDFTQADDSFAQSHSIELTSLSPDTDYDFKISATNAQGESIESSLKSFRTNVFDGNTYFDVPGWSNGDLVVTGAAAPNSYIEIFQNGIIHRSGKVPQSDGTVRITDITLATQFEENTLEFQVFDADSGAQTFSQEYSVQIDTQDPVITISDYETLLRQSSLELQIEVEEPVELVVTIVNEDESVRDPIEIDGSYTLALPLLENTNFVTLAFADRAGNAVVVSEEFYVDTRPPSFLRTNIQELSPSRSSSVTIVGTVSEPGIIVSATVNEQFSSIAACNDGRDNDNDGKIDYPYDPGCLSLEDIDETDLLAPGSQCSDGINNDPDEDSLIDFPNDPGCDDILDNDETDVRQPVVQCNNGIDDDGDGYIDFDGGPLGIGFRDRGCSSLTDETEDSENGGNQYTTFSESNCGEDGCEFELDIDLETQQFNYDFGTFDQGRERDNTVVGYEVQAGVRNQITLRATDRVGQTAVREDFIEYSSCASDPDIAVAITDLYPQVINPDALRNGYQQITFKLDAQYTGSSQTAIFSSGDVNPQRLSTYDERELRTSEVLGNCVFVPQDSDRNLKQGLELYVVCPLSQFPPEGFYNSTLANQILNEIGVLDIPVEIRINYQAVDFNGDNTIGTHKSCTSIQLPIDKQLIQADKIPKKLLNNSVEVIDEVVEGIDSVLQPLQTVKLATLGVCGGMFVANWFSAIGEEQVCLQAGFPSLSPNKIRLEQYVSGLKSFDDFRIKLPSDLEPATDEQFVNFESCAQQTFERLEFQEKRSLVCDRIACPNVPSLPQYIDDVTEAARYGLSTSACSQLDPNPWAFTANLNFDAFETENGCFAEYEREWGRACLGVDAMQASKELHGFEEREQGSGYSLNGILTNAKFCKAKRENDDQGDYFREGNVEYFYDDSNTVSGVNDPGGYKLSNTIEPGEVTDRTVVRDLRQQKLYINDATPESIRSSTTHSSSLLTMTVDNQNYLVFHPLGQKIGGSSTDLEKIEFDPQLTDSKQVNIDGQVLSLGVTSYVYGNNKETIYVDSQNRFYEPNGPDDMTLISPKKTKLGDTSVEANNGLGLLKQPCKRTNVAGQAEYGVIGEAGITEQNCQPIRASNKFNPGNIKQFIAEPVNSFIDAFRCACLPSIEGWLLQVRNILSAISNCFKSVLLTGQYRSGACETLLTTYVCDLLYEAIKCAPDALSGFGVQEGANTGDLFGSLKGASQTVADSARNRYGTTATYRSLIGDQKLIRGVCLAAFGYDWVPEIEQAVSIQGDGFEVPSLGYVTIASRQYQSFNPRNNGQATYLYNVGYFISAGGQMSYRIDLMCSNDNSCDPDDGYEDSRCDCARLPEGEAKFYTIDQGALHGGQTAGDGDGKGNVFIPISSDYRYDKVRISLIDQDGKVQELTNNLAPITQSGGNAPPTCFFSTTRGTYGCEYSASSPYGNIYFDQELTSREPLYKAGEKLSIDVSVIKDFTGVEPEKQFPKYSKLQIVYEGDIVHREDFKPIEGTDFTVGSSYRFTKGATPKIEKVYSLGPKDIEYITKDNIGYKDNLLPEGLHFINVFETDTPTLYTGNPTFYYIWFEEKKGSSNEYNVKTISMGSEVYMYGTVPAVLSSSSHFIQERDAYIKANPTQVYSKELDSIRALDDLTYYPTTKLNPSSDNVRLKFDKNKLEALMGEMSESERSVEDFFIKIPFQQLRPSTELCDVNDVLQKVEKSITAIVTLHDSKSRDPNLEPSKGNLEADPTIFVSENELQRKEIVIPFVCDVITQEEKEEGLNNQCELNTQLRQQSTSNCNCGLNKRLLEDFSSEYAVCAPVVSQDENKEEITTYKFFAICEDNEKPVVGKSCYCARYYSEGLAVAKNAVCTSDQVCKYGNLPVQVTGVDSYGYASAYVPQGSYCQ